MNDHDFMRYSRQLLLEDIAIEGQQKLLASRVLIIGLGGLGSPPRSIWPGLASARWCWPMTTTCISATCSGKSCSPARISIGQKPRPPRPAGQLNPQIELIALQQRLAARPAREVAKADVVLDCTDNMATRQAINAACVALDTPLLPPAPSASAVS
jgi:sulfur carrier protein ThiS adenylyltransferase